MADIIKILNGEAGFSVRDKLNEVIDKVNASAVVVPVGDAAVFDPLKAGGYPAGSIISYRNEASPDAQFQTFAIYVANSDIQVGVSPEDSAEWLFKGDEYTVEGGNTSKNYVNTITALRSVSEMKNGDTMIVGFESRIYEFVESSESGIKPFQAGVGSWMARSRVSLSNISRVYTSLDALENEEIPLPVGNVVISFADSCVFTITDGNGDAQLPVSLSQPSVVTRTGAGFLPSDIEIEPIGGGGHTILDPDGNTMPTQPALQFGAGFTVTDETGKTVVSRVITYSIDFGTTSIVAQEINMFGAAVIDNIIASNIASILLTYSGGLQEVITPGVNSIAITAGDILTWEITRTNDGQLAALGIHLSINE